MPGTTSTALPSISHDQHHETDAAKRKGGGAGARTQGPKCVTLKRFSAQNTVVCFVTVYFWGIAGDTVLIRSVPAYLHQSTQNLHRMSPEERTTRPQMLFFFVWGGGEQHVTSCHWVSPRNSGTLPLQIFFYIFRLADGEL